MQGITSFFKKRVDSISTSLSGASSPASSPTADRNISTSPLAKIGSTFESAAAEFDPVKEEVRDGTNNTKAMYIFVIVMYLLYVYMNKYERGALALTYL